MEYKEFQKHFREQAKKDGVKVTMKALNKSWKIHKKEQKKNEKTTKLPKTSVEQPKNNVATQEASQARAEKIEIQKQANDIIQSQPRSNEPTITEQPAEPGKESVKAPEISKPVQAPTVTSQEQLDRDKMYTAVADSVHQALAGVINLLTEKQIKIEQDKITRLNDCGVLLLKKYDKGGQLLEYSPEIAYVLTLADIGSQVYIEMKKRAPKQTPKPTLPAPASNTQQEVGDFNNLIKQAGNK